MHAGCMADVTATRSMSAPLTALAAGAVVALLVGAYGAAHEPTFDEVAFFGFDSMAAMKVSLASAVGVLAVLQLVGALWLYGKLPGHPPRWLGGVGPVLPRLRPAGRFLGVEAEAVGHRRRSADRRRGRRPGYGRSRWSPSTRRRRDGGVERPRPRGDPADARRRLFALSARCAERDGAPVDGVVPM